VCSSDLNDQPNTHNKSFTDKTIYQPTQYDIPILKYIHYQCLNNLVLVSVLVVMVVLVMMMVLMFVVVNNSSSPSSYRGRSDSGNGCGSSCSRCPVRRGSGCSSRAEVIEIS
jgi:hypothetical protein